MDLQLAQVGFINPVLNGLSGSGVNISRLLTASGLTKFDLSDSENYIPVQSMYLFFDAINQQHGINDFQDQFIEEIELASLSQWGEMIAYTPDVLTAIQTAVKYDCVVMSHERAGLEINGTKTKYWQRFTDNQTKGREQADFLSFTLAIKGFQLAAGKNWAPLEIHLQSDTAPNLDALLPSGNNTRIFLGQAATAVIFPTAMLSMPMLGNGTSAQFATKFDPSAPSLATKLDNLLSSTQNEWYPNLKQLAEITDSSTRTLQRKLTDEGSSVSEVINNWRFKTAIQLLEKPGMQIKDISQRLGYSNVPNFQRAFRRWTNTTPNRYRDLL